MLSKSNKLQELTLKKCQFLLRFQSLVNWHQFIGCRVGRLVNLEFSWCCVCNVVKNDGCINDGPPL